MDNGWVKIHRKIQDWEWYQDSKMVHLFLHFLTLANHEPGKWQGQQIETGQFITGRIELSQKTGISQQSIRTCITKLKSTSEITVKSTNKFSIITLVKWKDYQLKEKSSTTKSTSYLTNEQPAINQQSTTNKKDKNIRIKEDKNTAAKPLDEVNLIINIFQTINPGISYANLTNRKATEWLINKYGFEKASSTAEYAVICTGKPYAPTITTPYQLKEKLGSLIAFYKKDTAEGLTKTSKHLKL